MFAKVIIDKDVKALDKTFDYIIPQDMIVTPGMRVFVAFGSKVVQGFVVEVSSSCDCPPEKLKSILSIVDQYAAIKPQMLEVMDFMAKKFHLKLASILRLFIPTEMREGRVRELFDRYYFLADQDFLPSKAAKKQAALVEYLRGRQEKSSVLADMFGAAALKALADKGVIQVAQIQRLRKPCAVDIEDKKVVLNSMQRQAVDAVCQNKTYLLHGVTGSGKTEVYMHLISRVLQEGKNAILLVPEISLTPQILANFKARFGDMVAILHSGLSAGERFDEWRRLYSGDARIAIGPRSAIFAPLDNLGIIIIDEEHEQSYTSESNPRYSTHDIAEFRARQSACPLLLGSATPSIESYERAKRGIYQLVELPARANGKDMPLVQIVDMIGEIRSGNMGIFSNQLLSDLANIINQKKQAMLFVNRRGYSSFVRCRDCGYIAKCSDCDVSLVYHKEDNRLKCHYCGKQYKTLDRCPACHSDHLQYGAVGTQQVVARLQEIFKDVKILRMDNDTTSKKDAHTKILQEFRSTHPCILVGTQMIAKGHDFEDVLLVGVIDADQSLYQSDYRATERTFQLITQVSGRAGRGQTQGKVVLQTYSPRHYVYKFVANYDYKGFFKKEENIRQTAAFPPFSRIIRILFADENNENCRQLLKMCYNEIAKLKEDYCDEILYLDVMKAPIARVQNKFRYQILMRLKLDHADEIEDKAFEIVDKLSKNTVFFEINPSNMS